VEITAFLMNRSGWLLCALLVSASLGCLRGGPEEASDSKASGVPPASAEGAGADGKASLGPGEVVRTSAAETRRKVQAGESVLVCAYPETSKYERNKLAGSISMDELEQRAPSLPRDQELIFYCA
jgi:hypothetical protein